MESAEKIQMRILVRLEAVRGKAGLLKAAVPFTEQQYHTVVPDRTALMGQTV